jgi:glycosyltransferase involved in cell wall biosynthesis
MSSPSVTIVVPTYNRRDRLERVICALERQSCGTEAFDVVVVSDGSTDGTTDYLESLQTTLAITVEHQANAGPAAARNLGISKANGVIIAFTDDDCLPVANWLDRIHRRFAEGYRGCLHGAVCSSLPSSAFVHSVIADGAVITSNIALERRIFEDIGVFDAKFRAPWCEDADLHYRLKKAGIPITYDPALVVNHPPRYQHYWSFLRKSRFFQYYALIARKHPDMEPLSRHRDRLFLASKKITCMLAFILILSSMASAPLTVAVLLSPFLFCVVDGFRVVRLKSELARLGIRVQPWDQFLYVLLNWTSNIAESYYLLKGAVVYGFVSDKR